MAALGELAKLIRSKNAGPFNLTFDIMFESEDTYRKVIESRIITKKLINQIYGVAEDEIILVNHDAAHAIKISIPRPVFQCDLHDSDSFGGQQYGPLVEIDIP